ncbi:MAG: methionine adenosyltransferase [Candidatus Woesearchaeota archaeon]
MTMFLKTSESVTCGHPDKVCDQISDAILDAYLQVDAYAHVAVECFITQNTLIIGGEVQSTHRVDHLSIARALLAHIGYTDDKWGMDCKTVGIQDLIHTQSPDIAQGVEQQGAGDQGSMFGYACNETPEYLPLPLVIAHKLAYRLEQVRREGIIKHIGPDGKTQVAIVYEDDKPLYIEHITIAQQHTPDISYQELQRAIHQHVLSIVDRALYTQQTKVTINGTSVFHIGGPQADTGLTGRKIIVDTYGGYGHHGGGAFSGKDATKVDRSGAYMARYIAKNAVAKGYATQCEVQLSYAIGVAQPVAVNVWSNGDTQAIQAYIAQFDLSVQAIISFLSLRTPMYWKTSVYGHFGKPDLTWEKVK